MKTLEQQTAESLDRFDQAVAGLEKVSKELVHTFHEVNNTKNLIKQFIKMPYKINPEFSSWKSKNNPVSLFSFFKKK